MDNCREIPDSVTDILEFDDFQITFSGSREDFISFTKAREEKNKFQKEQEMTGFLNSLKELQDENFVLFSLDKNTAKMSNCEFSKAFIFVNKSLKCSNC